MEYFEVGFIQYWKLDYVVLARSVLVKNFALLFNLNFDFRLIKSQGLDYFATVNFKQ